jgi:multidrug efflux system membrane fusion protein
MADWFDAHGRRATLLAALFIAGILGGCTMQSARQSPSVPVTVALAESGNQPVTLAALGHVQGLNTAAARAQINGQILRVSFAEGQSVQAGQPLAQIDPRPLQAALAQDEATLARDRAALANANDNVTRTSPLVSQGLASAQQVEAYRSQAAQLSATVAGDGAAIQRARLTLGYATIRSPISGITGVRLIDPGNIVGPNDAGGIVTIAQVQPIAALFTLPQSAIGQVRTALASAGGGGLAVDALTQDGSAVLDHGRLIVIDNRVDDASGTITLKAVFPNASRLLWPGELMTARIVLGIQPHAVTVPASAIQRNSSGDYVWLVSAKGAATKRPVSLGMTIGDRVVIAHGLVGGEQVVTDGQFGLTSGVKVSVAQAGSTTAPVKSDRPDTLGIQS